MKKIFLSVMAMFVFAVSIHAQSAINTINEKEARNIVHSALKVKGIVVTKKLVGQILSTAKELSIAGLTAGKGIKFQGLGTIEVRTHKATTVKVPTTQNIDGTWNFRTIVVPAGKHIGISVAKSLKKAMKGGI